MTIKRHRIVRQKKTAVLLFTYGFFKGRHFCRGLKQIITCVTFHERDKKGIMDSSLEERFTFQTQ
jgi:hypothetical protein